MMFPNRGRLRGIGAMGDNKQEQQQSQGQSTTTAVSPTIQQSFTPNISPVFQQSSGGGSQSASTQQIAPGGQSGQGGSATGAPGQIPAAAGAGGQGQGYAGSSYAPPTYQNNALPSLAADPFYSGFDASKYGANLPLIQKNDDYTMYYIIGGLALAAAAVMFWPKKKGA